MMHDLSSVVARSRHLELAAFFALGGRAIEGEGRFASFFEGASRAHGFRAGLLESCLPVASGYPRDETGNDPAIDEIVETTCAGGEAADVFSALVGVFYSQLRDTYDELGGLASGPGDGFARRTFRRCRDDVAGVLEESAVFGVADAHSERSARVRALSELRGGLVAVIGRDLTRGAAFVPGQAPGRPA